MVNIQYLLFTIFFAKNLCNKSPRAKHCLLWASHTLFLASCRYLLVVINPQSYNIRFEFYCITKPFSIHVFLILKAILESNKTKIGSLLLDSLLA